MIFSSVYFTLLTLERIRRLWGDPTALDRDEMMEVYNVWCLAMNPLATLATYLKILDAKSGQVPPELTFTLPELADDKKGVSWTDPNGNLYSVFFTPRNSELTFALKNLDVQTELGAAIAVLVGYRVKRDAQWVIETALPMLTDLCGQAAVEVVVDRYRRHLRTEPAERPTMGILELPGMDDGPETKLSDHRWAIAPPEDE